MGEGPERVYQVKVTKALHAYGYVVDHTYRLQTQDGSWRTGSTWTGKPDIIAVRPPRVLAIELKKEKGKPSLRQLASLSLWAMVPCARVWVLTPATMPTDQLHDWLEHPAKAPDVYGFEPMTQLEAFRVLATAAQRANV